MLDHARQFLFIVLPEISPGTVAYYNIHWSKPGQNGKKFWDGRACETVDEAVKTIGWMLKQPSVPDLYVCMSSQSSYKEKKSAKGYVYKQAERFQTNAVLLRSLFIDIDVKEGAYPDTEAALEALKGFIETTNLPMPSAVVGSGSGGFHVHWALDKDLPREEWQVLANALAKAAKDYGLYCDLQCTIDSARILRVPGTLNNKHDLPQPVTLISLGERVSTNDISSVLSSYIVPTSFKPVVRLNDDLGAGLETKAKPISIHDVANGCAFIKRTLETGGATNPNPLWFLTAAIATFTEEEEEALHLMSAGHADYKLDDTAQLYHRVSQKQKASGTGWPQCEKIANYGCQECSSCPLLALKKSPLNHAIPSMKSIAKDTLPDQYFRNADGLIFRRIVDESGAAISLQISPYPMWDAWLSNNPWTLHFTTKTDIGPKTRLEIPTEVITAKDALAKYLGGKGIFLNDKPAKILKEFLLAWIQKLQNTKDAVVSSSPFGWSIVDGKREGFSYGGRVWTAGEDRPAINPDPVLQVQYSPSGDIIPWKELAKVITGQNRPGLDIILASAFAAPLVSLTSEPGLMVNAYSIESGIGKTTAMRIAQAVWGHPIRAMQGLDDTINMAMRKISSLSMLPLYWDEIKTDQQTQRFADLAFKLTSGKDKGRLKSDSSIMNSGEFMTMLVSASNDSILDAVQKANKTTNAGLYRTFEYTVEKVKPNVDSTYVDQLLVKLRTNFGQAGLAYAKFLGANHHRIEKELVEFLQYVEEKYDFQPEERFWKVTIATLLTGAKYANELDLTTIDLVNLEDFLVTVLGKMRGEVKAAPADISKDIAVSTILSQFLNAMRARHTLVTNRIWVSKGKPAAGTIKVLNDASKLQEIFVHKGKDDRLLRISSTAFSGWMADHGYSRHSFTKKMREEFGLKDVHGKLGGGTELACAMEYLIEIDLNEPKLIELVD